VEVRISGILPSNAMAAVKKINSNVGHIPLRPQNWGTGEKQLKSGKNNDAQLQTPQTLKLSW
jgi:hypothetical protein